MKATLLGVSALAGLATANIKFHFVQPTCNFQSVLSSRCLTGQHCTDQNTCVADHQVRGVSVSRSARAVELVQRQAKFSTDGKCGPTNGNLLCDPNATAYTGTCCSSYGWCGNSPVHCGQGCQSGCTSGQSSSVKASTPSSTVRAASAPSASSAGAPPRSDARCGKAYGGATCDPKGAFGGCCSSAGWCGTSTAHCLVKNGCQNGCTDGNPTQPQASSSKAAASSVRVSQASSVRAAATPTFPPNVRDDGRCGKDFAGAQCDPTGVYGGCCSSYGYCGVTDGHCLVKNGCQNGCTDQPKDSSGPPVQISSAASVVTGSLTRPPSITTSGEPVLGKPSSVVSVQAAPSQVITQDGSCGAKFNNAVCGTWSQGSCCSMYGYCGNTTAHCGEGCQSGPCAVLPVAAPGPSPAPAASQPGTLQIKGRSGVPAMHAGLLPNGKVVFLDKVENYTELKLGNGQYAYSSEYDPATQKLTALSYKTNAFCSGGIFLADGTFISVGGNAPLDFIDPTVGDGFKALRFLKRTADGKLDGQNWNEPGSQLDTARWYASVQIMPDNTIFVASGSLNGLDPSKPENNNPTYEILNADGSPQGKSIPMEILSKNQPYYMYPFMHLLNDGTLFVQVSKSAEIFNVGTGNVVRSFKDLPGTYRTYPNTGGSVLLGLSSKDNWAPDVVICGGGPYQDITAPADPSCGRIRPLDVNADWEMDSMPKGRVMVEGTLLPDGKVIWVNGAESGAQGFELAEDPTLDVLIYDPDQVKGKRWSTGPASTIPRLYHSVALLLLDGTLLISGSNPVEMPVLKVSAKEPFITEFRNEIYTPPYLAGNPTRPSNVVISSKNLKADGSTFTIKFNAPTASPKAVKVTLYYGGFVTHSVHMGHRMAFLDTTGFKTNSKAQTITVTMPPNRNVAPAGPYVIYVLVDGVPAIGQFVSVS